MIVIRMLNIILIFATILFVYTMLSLNGVPFGNPQNFFVEESTGGGEAYDYVENESNEPRLQPLEEVPETYIDQVNSSYLHFSNLTITFAMTGSSDSTRRQRMYKAFSELEEQVGEFTFIEVDNFENADIQVTFPARNNLKKIGEASPRYNSKGDIVGGEITIINVVDNCNYHSAEMHELLHVFGFDHFDKTIMHPYSDVCAPLTSEKSIQYVEHLKFIYSSETKGVEHPEIPMYEVKFQCPEGTYPSINSVEYCCPEPGMTVDNRGCYF